MTTNDVSQKPVNEPSILIMGGDGDFHLVRLMLRCNERGIPFYASLFGNAGVPETTYDLQSDSFVINGQIIKPKAAFLRPDVFSKGVQNPQHTKAGNAWFNVSIGWLMAHEEINLFNRRYFNRPRVNKLQTLILAKQIGLDVPETYVSNSIADINARVAEKDYVQKPVDGGDLCRPLGGIDKARYSTPSLAFPVIAQEKLVSPEMRIFRVGEHFMAYDVSSQALDYREDGAQTRLKEVEPPAALTEKLEKLCDAFGLDFAAADFKTCPQTKKLLLLEINSGPMFAGFDQVSDFRLIDCMIDSLLQL